MASIGKEVGKRLSVKELGYDKGAIAALVLADQNARHFLARFIGVATGLRPYKIKEGDRAGETAFGLIGQFKGEGANGNTLEASVLYLPSYVSEMLTALFSQSDVESMRIAFDVYAEYNDKAATMYSFIVNDLLNEGSQGVDEVAAVIKALPLPSATIAIEDKTGKK